MPAASIIIPVASYHQQIVQRAIDSAQAQTVSCEVITFVDDSGRGAGYARNVGAGRANGEFLVFLDADDYLEPQFVERCLQAYRREHYVYTAWYEGAKVRRPHSCHPYYNDNHLVTTLYPRAAFVEYRAFDETLPGDEDLDFYLRSAYNGLCGVYVDSPLLHYSGAGQRSKRYKAMSNTENIHREIYERNGGAKTLMTCCGGEGEQASAAPNNEQQASDVLAQYINPSVRSEFGAVSGREYRPATTYGRMWVDLRDIKARPGVFKIVQTARDLTPDPADVLRKAGLL